MRHGRVIWLRTDRPGRREDGDDARATLDFVFVDNAQTYEDLRVEWEAWAPVIASGGVIALHDTRPWPAGRSPPDERRLRARRRPQGPAVCDRRRGRQPHGAAASARMTAIITADDFGLDQQQPTPSSRRWPGTGSRTPACSSTSVMPTTRASWRGRAGSRPASGCTSISAKASRSPPALKDCPDVLRRRPLPAGRRVPALPAAQRGSRRRLVAAEVRAQLAAAASPRHHVSHLDSHNDVHIAPSIAQIVADVAREFHIPRVRISRNCGLRQGVLRRVHHRTYNAWLTRRRLRGVLYYGSRRRHGVARPARSLEPGNLGRSHDAPPEGNRRRDPRRAVDGAAGESPEAVCVPTCPSRYRRQPNPVAPSCRARCAPDRLTSHAAQP